MKMDEVLSSEAKEVFLYLAKQPEMSGFCLIGGTALALQVGHRRSQDLDFCLFDKKLNTRALSSMLKRMESDGFNIRLATSPSLISSSLINGVDILDLAQDYQINNTKVTFFARYDEPYQFFSGFKRTIEPGSSFDVMGLEGLFSMKSHVIHKRLASRDLFDLKWFISNGRQIQEILDVAQKADLLCSSGHAVNVLTGKVPVGPLDEGLDAVGVTESLEDIYVFFEEKVNEMETSIARTIKQQRTCTICKKIPCGCGSRFRGSGSSGPN